MAFRVEETFRIQAPPERVWAYLVDPGRVVGCLPGAELVEVVDGDEFRGRISVSVGPVSVAYRGTATFAEVDADARRVRIEARGEEASGPGSAAMTMESRVTESGDGAEVEVTADVEVAGKIVQFGRGMIETVSEQLFRQFTDCARTTLEGAEQREADGGGASTTDPSPATREGAAPEPVDGVSEAGSGSGDAGESDRGERGEGDSLRVIPLLFSALWQKLRSLFGRGR